MNLTIVFVHGWSVTNLNTYGELPLRLKADAAKNGTTLEIKDIFLGRYISFHDEVRMTDISHSFQAAVEEQLSEVLLNGNRFICITHSTGGPVVRDWWNKYYNSSNETCPMSHLIMLAPANYGSALAQLGKGKLSRLKSWWAGVEPGQGILDWLAIGSGDAWELNKDWIFTDVSKIGEKGIFPFVITGQAIDRKFYDHLNPYTGETGSDGVVRVAAANLQGRYLELIQPVVTKKSNDQLSSADFIQGKFQEAPATALRVLSNKSHSGDDMGIMKSVKQNDSTDASTETIHTILSCIQVQNSEQYATICKQFEIETILVQERERLEIESEIFNSDRLFFHDRHSMLIFRVRDTEGFPVTDYDLILTAGINNDPDHLPEGFFEDRQRNLVNKEIITYYFNYDAMKGLGPVKNDKGEIVRPSFPGTDKLGFEIHPRPDAGFVKYLPCKVIAHENMLQKVLVPNSTTLIDITLQRIVFKETTRFEPITDKMPPDSISDFSTKMGSGDIVK